MRSLSGLTDDQLIDLRERVEYEIDSRSCLADSDDLPTPDFDEVIERAARTAGQIVSTLAWIGHVGSACGLLWALATVVGYSWPVIWASVKWMVAR